MMNPLNVPVFPLPDIVFFPRVVLPLHIFEPRYKDMINDILKLPKEKQLIAITSIQGKHGNKILFENIVTVGRIIFHEPYKDGSGKLNIVLLGEFTAEVEEIEDVNTKYRQVKIIEIRDEYWINEQEEKSKLSIELNNALLKFSKRTRIKFEDLSKLPLEDLINSLSFSINVSTSKKHDLLKIQDFGNRIRMLVKLIDTIGYYVKYVPNEEDYIDIN